MTNQDSFNDSWHEQPMEDAAVTVSQMLVQAREAKGLSQKDVADQLFLSATFIRYIDEGEFEKLPKAAFIRGYLRSYARVVDLDDGAVVAAYERDQNITRVVPEIGHVTEEEVGSGAFTGPVVLTGIVGLVVIIIVGGLVWWLSSSGKSTPPVVAENGSPVLSQEPSVQLPKRVNPNRLNEAADTQAGNPATGESPAPDAVAPTGKSDMTTDTGGTGTPPPTEAESLTTGAAASVTAGQTGSSTQTTAMGGSDKVLADGGDQSAPKATDVTIDRKRDGNKQFITVRAGSGNDTLAFSFSDQCWVEITDGRGKKIYGDLNRAGDVMTVYGTGPFDVLLGKAPAVTLTWQGKPVDLARYTNKDQTAVVKTARL